MSAGSRTLNSFVLRGRCLYQSKIFYPARQTVNCDVKLILFESKSFVLVSSFFTPSHTDNANFVVLIY